MISIGFFIRKTIQGPKRIFAATNQLFDTRAEAQAELESKGLDLGPERHLYDVAEAFALEDEEVGHGG